jgi:hypothetical protein
MGQTRKNKTQTVNIKAKKKNECELGHKDLHCIIKSIITGRIRRFYDKKNTQRKYIDNILQTNGIGFDYLLRSNFVKAVRSNCKQSFFQS